MITKLNDIIKGNIAVRQHNLNKTVGYRMATSVSISSMVMGYKIDEILKGNIELMTSDEKKKYLFQIYEKIVEEYGVNNTDSKALWKELESNSKANAYHNFELVFAMLEHIDKLNVFKNLGKDLYSFAFRIFMLILNKNLDKLSSFKSVSKLYTEAVKHDSSTLFKDLKNIPLGYEKDVYEQWQKNYVSEVYGNLQGMDRYRQIKERMQLFKKFDKGTELLFENPEIAEIYNKFARLNLRKSINRMLRGWDY